jgi:hypothetical protein
MTIQAISKIAAGKLASLQGLRVIVLAGLMGLCQSGLAQQSLPNAQAQRAAIEAELKMAIREVQGIVNQPVTQMKRTAEMQVSTYKPGWFHEGAAKPDFNNVDVRTTRDTAYAKNQYVTSDLNPGVVFLGSELEFNSMTKYFYADYSLPKKKLSEGEMLEVNRLYRVIGRCQQQLGI